MKRVIMLMRAGADVSDIDLDRNHRLRIATAAWRQQQLQLQHICREKIRLCVMAREPGKQIAELVGKLGLPETLVDYVADVHRYV